MKANSFARKEENHSYGQVSKRRKCSTVYYSDTMNLRSSILAKDPAQQKLAVRYLQQELYEANDANLVDEEDMHIFGLHPMTDPLELVICNACKKPIKTSHYAVHAELCKTLNLSEEVALELGNGKVKKKPPRKERKKAVKESKKALKESKKVLKERKKALKESKKPLKEIKKALALCSRQEVLKTPLASDIALKEPHLEEQTLNYSANAKRKYKQKRSTVSKKIPNDICNYGKPERERGAGKTDLPVPIATKVYYSQSYNRLRSSLSHMYHVASSTDHCTKVVTTDVMHINFTPHASYSELVSGNQDRTREKISSTLQQSEQMLAQCPKLFLREAGEFPPVIHNPQSVHVDNGLKPQYHIEREISNYNSRLTRNSGQPPESLQQPEGSASYV